jgi:hypothetical protein
MYFPKNDKLICEFVRKAIDMCCLLFRVDLLFYYLLKFLQCILHKIFLQFNENIYFFLIDVVLYPNLMKIHLFSYFDIFTIYSKYKFSKSDGELLNHVMLKDTPSFSDKKTFLMEIDFT